MRALFVVAMLTLFIASPGTAQVEIDLATTPAALSIWGGMQGEDTGIWSQVGDINGDGAQDIIFAQPNWFNAANEEVGRVCAFLGPYQFPLVHDLFTTTPPLCIEASASDPMIIRGLSVQVDDLDGDGIDDLLLGTLSSVSIFKGRATWPSVLAFGDADWHFIEGLGDSLRYGVIGDLNGDDVADLVLFAGEADGPNDTRIDAGEGYIFFGPTSSWTKTEFDMSVDVPDVLIYGADGQADNSPPTNGGDFFGFNEGSAVIADLVGDRIPDLIVAAYRSAGGDNLTRWAGEVYVFRGRANWPTIIDTKLAGTADLIVYGAGPGTGVTGPVVADIDGDGNSDLLIAAGGYSRPGFGRDDAGGIFVLRGGPSLVGVWDLAAKDADSTIIGREAGDILGHGGARVGDVNGDSYVDVIAGALGASAPFARTDAGAVYVIAGCEGLIPIHDLSLIAPELTIYGADAGEFYGGPVRVVDFDNDGFVDILATGQGEGFDNLRGPRAGELHLVLGRPFGTPPACTITPDPGPAVEICGTTTDVTLDGSLSIIFNCGVTPQYRWMDGPTELRGWNIDPTFVVRPTATTAYRLEVRCGDCAGPCFETATVLGTVDPDVTPPSLGNTVRAYRSGSDVELEWGSVTEARTYSLYRGTQKEAWPPTPLSSLTATTETLPDVPGPPNLYFYRVSGASCSGNEGP